MRLSATFILFLALTACAAPARINYEDRDAQLNRADYENALAPRSLENNATNDISDFIVPPATSSEHFTEKRITINLSGTESTKSIFQELARKAGLSLEMDPGLTGSPVIFAAKDEPLQDVIERIAAQANVRASLKKKALRVENDTPYQHSYRVDYPNIARATQNNISSSLNIAKTENTEAKNDSALNTDGKTVADFWTELDHNLAQLLQLEASVSSNAPAASYSINRQAGLVNVRGTQKQQKIVETYLKELSEAAQAQVLIEARILEVNLEDSFSSGINWNTLTGGALELGFNAPAGFPSAKVSPVPNSLPGVSLGVTNNDFEGLFNFLQHFGTVRALSSPRMTVMQNQVGVIKVVRNEVYFRLIIQTTDATTNSPQRRDVTSEQRTVPVGLIMNVQPSIDLATGRVTLALRPTITRIAAYRTDPGILIAASDAGLSPSQVDSAIPIVAVQEMDSVVSVQSGQTLVMGGLMRDATTATTDGIPGTQEMRLLRYLTNARDDTTSKSELVVFLKASIVKQPQSSLSAADRDLYYGMSGDRRPMNVDPINE